LYYRCYCLFGLSKIVGTSTYEDLLHHSPGYALAEFSDSENAYSFSMVLFELIMDKEPLGDESLVLPVCQGKKHYILSISVPS
jgi:hypothetical protein